jgi:uncharacterized protein YbjT (DUF2867 family)
MARSASGAAPREDGLPLVVVTGATGRLGRLVVEGLKARGARIRVLSGRPADARALLGADIEVAAGRFEDEAALGAAFAGADRLLLLSPLTESMAAGQIAAAKTAARAGLRRIVKISGSDWTIEPEGSTLSGDAHRRVEEALAATGLETVALRPNAWMQTSLGPALERTATSRVLALPYGERPVSFIDARDIADVAVAQLLAPAVAAGPLVLTGPRAVTAGEIATLTSGILGHPVGVKLLSRAELDAQLTEAGAHAFHRTNVTRFVALLSAGVAAGLTPTVEQLLRRPPRGIERFLGERLGWTGG